MTVQEQINEIQNKIIRGKHKGKNEHLGKPIITIIGSVNLKKYLHSPVTEKKQ